MSRSDISVDDNHTQSALVIGATGTLGSVILQDLLRSKNFDHVGEFGRHVTEPAKLPAEAAGKLEQKIIDFEHLDAVALREGHWNVIFIALGTSQRAAGGSANFEKVDREYVLDVARALKADDGHPQRLVYVSATSADPASKNLYLRSKGLTEKGLAEIGYDDLIIFRPGYLYGVSSPNGKIGAWARRPFVSLASHFSDKGSMDASSLTKSILIAGSFGSAALREDDCATAAWDGPSFTVIDNAATQRVHERVNR